MVTTPRPRTGRDVVAGILVGIAILVAGAGLAAWFGSLLVQRIETELSSLVLGQSTTSLYQQLEGIDPGVAHDPQAKSAISSALKNPSVDQSVAQSPTGSSELQRELSSLDPSLGPVLAGHSLTVDTGRHDAALAAKDLRNAALGATLASLALVALAMLVAGRRDLVLRRVGIWAAVIGVSAIISTWLVPWLVLRNAKPGTGESVAKAIYQSGAPSHVMFVVLAVAGLLGAVVARLLTRPAWDAEPPPPPPGFSTAPPAWP
jgi:hypothetical protein